MSTVALVGRWHKWPCSQDALPHFLSEGSPDFCESGLYSGSLPLLHHAFVVLIPPCR